MFSSLLLLAISLSLCIGDCELPLYESRKDCEKLCTVAYGAYPLEATPVWQGQCWKQDNGTCYECSCKRSDKGCQGRASQNPHCEIARVTGCILNCYKDRSICKKKCGEGYNFYCFDSTPKVRGLKTPATCAIRRCQCIWGFGHCGGSG